MSEEKSKERPDSSVYKKQLMNDNQNNPETNADDVIEEPDIWHMGRQKTEDSSEKLSPQKKKKLKNHFFGKSAESPAKRKHIPKLQPKGSKKMLKKSKMAKQANSTFKKFPSLMKHATRTKPPAKRPKHANNPSQPDRNVAGVGGVPEPPKNSTTEIKSGLAPFLDKMYKEDYIDNKSGYKKSRKFDTRPTKEDLARKVNAIASYKSSVGKRRSRQSKHDPNLVQSRTTDKHYKMRYKQLRGMPQRNIHLDLSQGSQRGGGLSQTMSDLPNSFSYDYSYGDKRGYFPLPKNHGKDILKARSELEQTVRRVTLKKQRKRYQEVRRGDDRSRNVKIIRKIKLKFPISMSPENSSFRLTTNSLGGASVSTGRRFEQDSKTERIYPRSRRYEIEEDEEEFRDDDGGFPGDGDGGGDNIKVINMARNIMEPHDFIPSPVKRKEFKYKKSMIRGPPRLLFQDESSLLRLDKKGRARSRPPPDYNSMVMEVREYDKMRNARYFYNGEDSVGRLKGGYDGSGGFKGCKYEGRDFEKLRRLDEKAQREKDEADGIVSRLPDLLFPGEVAINTEGQTQGAISENPGVENTENSKDEVIDPNENLEGSKNQTKSSQQKNSENQSEGKKEHRRQNLSTMTARMSGSRRSAADEESSFKEEYRPHYSTLAYMIQNPSAKTKDKKMKLIRKYYLTRRKVPRAQKTTMTFGKSASLFHELGKINEEMRKKKLRQVIRGNGLGSKKLSTKGYKVKKRTFYNNKDLIGVSSDAGLNGWPRGGSESRRNYPDLVVDSNKVDRVHSLAIGVDYVDKVQEMPNGRGLVVRREYKVRKSVD